jgi:hypothetical protein
MRRSRAGAALTVLALEVATSRRKEFELRYCSESGFILLSKLSTRHRKAVQQ